MELINFDFERRLQEEIASFYADPYGFVMFVFPWGVEGTTLEDETGPDTWQREQLQELGQLIRDKPLDVKRFATASGHGIGKSAQTAWIVLWAMSTRPHLSGVVTANTFSQLKTKTWRELAIWHKLALNKHWFEWTQTKFHHVAHKESWYFASEANSEKNSEAFAGRHSDHVIQIYDEASAIPDVIWEVSEGATTDLRSLWMVFGNPTRNVGRFKACFTSHKKLWHTRKIDSRQAKRTNKKVIEEWRETYGEDSDFFRVRVLGEFPHTTSMQFISENVVDAAITRHEDMPFEAYGFMPLVMAADIARGGEEQSPRGDYGGDDNIVVFRRGRKLIEIHEFAGRGDTMHVVSFLKKLIDVNKPDVVFMDEVGVGAGVVDRLRELHYKIIGVNAHVEPDEPRQFFDKRIEMWYRMRDWLTTAALPNDPKLKEDLITPQFGHTSMRKRGEVLMLEKKKHTRAAMGRSPDRGDALAYSFYHTLAGRADYANRGEGAEVYSTHGPGYYEPTEAEII